MPSNYTEHCQLNQWEAEDNILRADFNADNAKIDAALKAVNVRVDGKADQSALDAETQVRAAAVLALNREVARRGNCQMRLTSYVGDGTAKDKRTTIYFEADPVACFIFNGDAFAYLIREGETRTAIVYYHSGNYGSVSTAFYDIVPVWGDRQVSIWQNDAQRQLNVEGQTYWVLALYSLED